MKILLDTLILVWYFAADEKLSQQARKLIANDENEIYFSTLAIFEIDLKHANHPDVMPFDGNGMLEYCRQADFKELPLNVKHTLAVKTLTRKENTPPHRDPFDRLMIAQAIVESMIFITHDMRIAEYTCPLIYKI